MTQLIQVPRETLENWLAVLLPHKSTVLRWITPTDQAINEIKALLDAQSEPKVMSKAFCNPASHDWRDDVSASDYLNE